VEWTCAHCRGINWSPKTKCAACGLRKSFSQVVRSWSAAAPHLPPAAPAPPGSAPVPPGQNPIRAQLERVTASLVGLAPPPADPAPPAPADSRAGSSTAKAELSNRIKSIEAAIALLPSDPDFDWQRDALRGKVSDMKREISDAKPIGARIDGARAALQRSQERRAEAERALALAQAVVSAAEAETDKIAGELAELEAALAHSHQEAAEAVPSLSSSPVEALGVQLAQFLSALKADEHVDPTHFSQAEAHVNQLIAGFEATLSHAGLAREAAGKPPRRLAGKQAPPQQGLPAPSEPVEPSTRLTGKQPPKRVITDFFKRAAPYPTSGFAPASAAEMEM